MKMEGCGGGLRPPSLTATISAVDHDIVSRNLTVLHVVQSHTADDRNIRWAKDAQDLLDKDALRALSERKRLVSDKFSSI